jgi:hypothetical protein
MTATRPPAPFQVALQAPDGQTATIPLQARDRAHAVASAVELAGLGRGALVLQCHRVGEW